ncbi:MAG: alpha/beta fold hydrolase [Armatimonadota bacterium]
MRTERARERFDCIDGVRTFSRVEGSGPEVVLVHGAGVSTEYWRPAQRELAEAGPFRVHALDLPGFGRSDDPPWALRLPTLAHHLGEWLEQVVPERCVLVGQSLGCEVALLCAAARPEQVRKLVLVGPAALPHLRSLTIQLARAALDAPRESLALYRAIIPAYWRCGPLRLLHMLLEQKRYDFHTVLRRTTQPTLVLRGTEDPVVAERRAREVADLLPCGEYGEYPGPHGSHFSHAPELAAAMLPFLTRAE